VNQVTLEPFFYRIAFLTVYVLRLRWRDPRDAQPKERPAADEQRVIIVVPIHNIFAHTKVSWRLPVCHRSYTECREDFESGGVRQLTLVSQEALYG
jgi:hypothetical protein